MGKTLKLYNFPAILDCECTADIWVTGTRKSRLESTKAKNTYGFKIMKYHHLGIPTRNKLKDEEHLKDFKMYVSGFGRSPYGVEWNRFEDDAPYPELVKTIPHVAFEVEDLEVALIDKNVIIKPNSPSPGVLVAFIEDNGAPIELLQIDRSIAGDNV